LRYLYLGWPSLFTRGVLVHRIHFAVLRS
jgi:hypothetical protein